MNSIILSNIEEVNELCRRYDVAQLEVFGSAARDDFNARTSDLDFIVQFRNAGQPGYADRYLQFAEELEELFGRKVDLITGRSLRNPIFVRSIEQNRETIYAG